MLFCSVVLSWGFEGWTDDAAQVSPVCSWTSTLGLLLLTVTDTETGPAGDSAPTSGRELLDGFTVF